MRVTPFSPVLARFIAGWDGWLRNRYGVRRFC